MGGMGDMMAGMMPPSPSAGCVGGDCGSGGTTKTPIYPSLMTLPALTPEKRAEIDALATQQINEGMARLAKGSESLNLATTAGDNTAIQQSVAAMRGGLDELEAGIEARRVLAEGGAPRNLALGWFKRDMNLATPIPREEPLTLLGVTPFHLFTMLLLVTFALVMIAMYFFKMRRAAALFGRLEADSGRPPPGSSPPLAGAPPPSTGAPPSTSGGTPPGDPPSDPPSAPPAGGPPDDPPSGKKEEPLDPPSAPPSEEGPPARKHPGAHPIKHPVKHPVKHPTKSEATESRASAAPPGGPVAPTTPVARAAPSGGAPSRPVSPATTRPLAANWRGHLQVGSIITETPTVKTFRLRPAGKSSLPFTFVPGQFLNVAFSIGGARMNRSYSISSSPTQRDYVDLTIRREPRGAVSRHINDLLAVGDEIETGGPVGRFTFAGTEADSIVLIAGGVGITPMLSISRYLTEVAWPGEIFLIYTCRTPADFIFRSELAALQRVNAKLHVTVTMSRPEGTKWEGPRGRLTKELLTETVPNLPSRRVHLCGPPTMMDSAKVLLAELGVPPDQVKTEAFGATKPVPVSGADARPIAPATGPLVTFSKNNKSAKIHMDLQTGDTPPKQSILELSEELGIGIEFSCRVGTCGICKVKMTSGEVDQAIQDALDSNDKAHNIILACQAKPKGDVVVEA